MALIDNWHIDALAEHLQAIARGQIRFLMINIGPGYAKSVIASVQFSAWLWTFRPTERILAGTYASDLTVRDSVRTRDLIASDWYQTIFLPEWSFSRKSIEYDAQRVDDTQPTGWRLVKQNEDFISNSVKGERRALSVGGKATGFRGNGQIFDDLLNASDAQSESRREEAREWAISTMSSRFNDMRNGWRVCIGQRLHELDPYGAMLATGDYEHLCLPSEFEPNRRSKTSIGWSDPRQTEGELLFPELFTQKVLDKAKLDLGSYGYAGQHQQRPSPAEGGIVKRDWWQSYKTGQTPAFDFIAISADATFKETKESDFVAIHVYGCIGPRTYLLDRVHERMSYIATKQAISAKIQRWKPRAILIEDKANGPAIIAELSKALRGIIPITPDGSKESRAWACSVDVEAGNVYLPADATGVFTTMANEVIEEWATFPNGAHDDDVDAMTQMLNWLRRRTIADTIYGSCFTDDLQYDDEWLAKNNPGLRNAGGYVAQFIGCYYATANQMAFVRVIDDGTVLWFDEEMVWDPLIEFRQKSDVEHLNDLKEWIKNRTGVEVVINEDAKSFRTSLAQNGLWHTKVTDDVAEGIRRFSSMMSLKRCRFNTRCVHLIDQMANYKWDDKAASRGDEKPAASPFPAAEAARLVVLGKIPNWRLL